MNLMSQQLDEIHALRDRMNRLFADGGGAASGAVSAAGAGARAFAGPRRDDNTPSVWLPAVDVVENEHEIILHAELPGMNKEDIDIQLTGDTLTLRGERRRGSVQRGENYHRIERQYGAFQRIFQIETPIDASKVAASYDEGVLTVTLPKQDLVKSRQIAIDVK